MRHLSPVLRGMISIGLLAWLFAQTDFQQLGRTLATAEVHWLLLANLLTPLTLACGVLKWWLLLRARDVLLPAGALTRYYAIGQFWNNFLPANFGGDVVRAVFATRRVGRSAWPIVASSIAVERLTGLYGLFFTLPVGILLHLAWVEELDLLLPLGVATLAVVSGGLLVFGPSGGWLLSQLRRLPMVGRLVNPIEVLRRAILAYGRMRMVLLQCLVISFIFYFLEAFRMEILTWAFPQVSVAWTTQIVIFCSVSLLALLPISINGYGVIEGAYTLMLVSLGFSLDEALAIALAYRLVMLVLAIAGGILFAVSDLSREEIDREARQGTPG